MQTVERFLFKLVTVDSKDKCKSEENKKKGNYCYVASGILKNVFLTKNRKK